MARALKHFLQRALETPLTRQLISGAITYHTRVIVDLKKGELLFEAKAGKRWDGSSRVERGFTVSANFLYCESLASTKQ